MLQWQGCYSTLTTLVKRFIPTQQTHNVVTASLQRRCSVTTLQRRCNDVVRLLGTGINQSTVNTGGWVVSESRLIFLKFNPFTPSGLFYLNTLDQSISRLRCVCQFLLLPCFIGTPVINANSVDPTQLAFYVNLHRAVIGPSATLTGRWRPDIDLRRMLTG